MATNLKLEEQPQASVLTFSTPPDEPVRYSVSCIPARDDAGRITDWSMKRLGDPGYLALLRAALPKEVRTFYTGAFDPMSGSILPPQSFSIERPIDRMRALRSPGYIRGTDARTLCEGTELGPRDAFMGAFGGCSIVVLSGMAGDRELCIAAHAGRNSLADMCLIQKGKHSRAHFSVLDAMVAYAEKRHGAEPGDLTLRSFFALPWHRYPHDVRDPRHGTTNEKLQACLRRMELGGAFLVNDAGEQCLSLPQLIRLRAEQLCIGRVEAGLLGLPDDGGFAWASRDHPVLTGKVRNLTCVERA